MIPSRFAVSTFAARILVLALAEWLARYWIRRYSRYNVQEPTIMFGNVARCGHPSAIGPLRKIRAQRAGGHVVYQGCDASDLGSRGSGAECFFLDQQRAWSASRAISFDASCSQEVTGIESSPARSAVTLIKADGYDLAITRAQARPIFSVYIPSNEGAPLIAKPDAGGRSRCGSIHRHRWIEAFLRWMDFTRYLAR
jgi:hypothetical protein